MWVGDERCQVQVASSRGGTGVSLAPLIADLVAIGQSSGAGDRAEVRATGNIHDRFQLAWGDKGGTMTRKASHVILTAILLFASMVAGQVAAAPEYSGWSAPVNLGPVVNSPFSDQGPAVSKNGLSLYFTSTRPGGFGGFDIWVSQRASLDDPWGLPINLGPTINTGFSEAVPALSRDGHLLFFNSNRPGGLGGVDLWVTWRR